MLEPLEITGEIVKIGKVIYERVQLVKANRAQCQRLAERIQIVVGALDNLDQIEDSKHFREALMHMQGTLNECLDFVTRFTKKGSVKTESKLRYLKFCSFYIHAVMNNLLKLSILDIIILRRSARVLFFIRKNCRISSNPVQNI